MAPTPTPVQPHTLNPSSGKHFRRIRRRALGFSQHPSRQSSVPRTEQLRPQALDTTLRPSVIHEGPPPPPVVPVPSVESPMITPEPSATPVEDNQSHASNPPGDIPGNIVAAVVVVVLILGGLIGLVVGGEMLRRRMKITGETTSPSRYPRRRKVKPTKNAVKSPQKHVKTSRERFPYDEKTLSPLTQPAPVLNRERERQRRLSGIWPIRSLSWALCDRQAHSKQVDHGAQNPSPTASSPQTTWSDFSPVSLYVAPPRTVLPRIPEEVEDYQTQTDIAAILNGIIQRSSDVDPVVSTHQMKRPESPHSMFSEDVNAPESLMVAVHYGSQNSEIMPEVGMGNEDTKSLESSAPDMTSDGDESSRSSTASLESLEDGNDRESIGGEMFELRRAQTRSMQMNKGVLLSLSLKTLSDGQNLMHGEPGCSPSQSPSVADAGGKDYAEPEMRLAMLAGSFSAVNLDEFPSPPSILPVIPSFVSGF